MKHHINHHPAAIKKLKMCSDIAVSESGSSISSDIASFEMQKQTILCRLEVLGQDAQQ
jgi:hypothetical protein